MKKGDKYEGGRKGRERERREKYANISVEMREREKKRN